MSDFILFRALEKKADDEDDDDEEEEDEFTLQPTTTGTTDSGMGDTNEAGHHGGDKSGLEEAAVELVSVNAAADVDVDLTFFTARLLVGFVLAAGTDTGGAGMRGFSTCRDRCSESTRFDFNFELFRARRTRFSSALREDE